MPPGRAGSPDGLDTPAPGEIYLEYTVVGAQMRAVAIDATTGIEVTVFGPARVPRDELGRLAVRKLQRRIEQGDGTEHGGEAGGGARFA
jgi:hypothetical protein